MYSHSQNYKVVTFQIVQRNWNFAQVRIQYRFGQLYVHSLGSPTENQAPTHWNMTAA